MDMITLKDIASACGVSVATVSRALTGSGGISLAQVERIRKTAREMGYVPNAAARALKTNRSFMLGILYEDRMNHEYFSLMIDAIRRRAEERGFDLTFLARTAGDGMTEYPEHAARRNLDGVVIVQALWQAAGIQRLLTGPLPCVAVDYAQPGIDAVLSDNFGSMVSLVQEAYARGYRRFAFIHGEDGYVTQERLRGFREGLKGCGLTASPEMILPARFRRADVCFEAARRLTALPEPPQCIFFPDDYSLMGVIDRCRQQGTPVPGLFGAVGYDSIGPADVFYPRLFTFRQAADRIGSAAVDRLLELVLNGARSGPEQIVIPGEIVRGDTLPVLPGR